MGWNYRVIRSEHDGEATYVVHECYYDYLGLVVHILTVKP